LYLSGLDEVGSLSWNDRSIVAFPEGSNFERGHVLGNATIGVGDALAILRYLVGRPNPISNSEGSFQAALIVSTEKPAVQDALQILRHLAGLPSVFD
jgi:hypothetical protein